MTNRHYIVHDNMLAGVEMTAPGHLVQPTQWRRAHNFHFTPMLEQVPLKVESDLSFSGKILWAGFVPTVSGVGYFLILTDEGLFYRDGSRPSGAAAKQSDERWATCVYNGRLYYTNPANPIRYSDGTRDRQLSGAPAGKYLLAWYDHLVVGWPTYKGASYPQRIMISHLYDFTQWDASSSNEADFYDLVEWQRADYPYIGITGMAELNGLLVVYTPTAIIPVQYVGLPKVIMVLGEQRVANVGNAFPWALVALDKVHFFYDGIEQNFFAYDGQQVLPIGDPVRKWFAETISPDAALQRKTWAYVDVEQREVHWVFIAGSSNTYNQELIFNYRQKAWSTADTKEFFCFCAGLQDLLTVGELEGTVGDLEGTIGDLGEGVELPRLYGATSKFLVDADSKTADGEFEGMESVLETGDFHYGSLHDMKEVDAVVVNAYHSGGDGAEVYVHGRQMLVDEGGNTDPNWATLSPVGMWTNNTTDGLLTFLAVAGRIFRYRFVFKKARAVKFLAFSAGVRGKGAER